MTLKTFVMSSDLFSYYEKDIDLKSVETIEEIIIIVTSELRQLLKDNNLTILCDKLSITKFHVHDYTIEDIKKDNGDKKYYICSECGL